ncbi:hypothetical protein UFOVP816_31 [uncultured Caudovirales phage]|uniref:Uncharacterized protein n=1 Tax=uncultured Caudovirales phage TaxID=2100421 RepID=A0A6J5NZ85_9CAUD|nr:hypothetical protein UFOVP816_31 [uncultured Caudovirales phage]
MCYCYILGITTKGEFMQDDLSEKQYQLMSDLVDVYQKYKNDLHAQHIGEATFLVVIAKIYECAPSVSQADKWLKTTVERMRNELVDFFDKGEG